MPNLKKDYDPYEDNSFGRNEQVVFFKGGARIQKRGIVETAHEEAHLFWLHTEAVQKTWESLRVHCHENSLPFLNQAGPEDWLYYLLNRDPDVSIVLT